MLKTGPFITMLAGMIQGPGMGPPPPLPPEALVEAVDPTRVAYLRGAQVAGGTVEGPFTFAFGPDFYRNTLYLVGESHGSAAPHRFDAALLEHLATRVGVRDYIAEVDPVQADHLNRYLASGDPAALAPVFDQWKATGAQWASRSYADKIAAVRALDQQLGGRPFAFHGLDRIQHFPGVATWLAARGVTVDAAALTAATSRVDKARLLRAVLPAGTDATLAALRRTLDAEIAGDGREAIAAANFAALRAGELGKRPAYGMWGLFHVLQAPMDRSVPFAALLQARGGERIASIALVPIDSKALMPVPTGPATFTPMKLDLFNVTGPISKMEGSADLAAVAPAGRVTVYDLDRPGSPYRNVRDFIAVKTSIRQDLVPADPALPTTRYARYVGVVRGSDWSPPY